MYFIVEIVLIVNIVSAESEIRYSHIFDKQCSYVFSILFIYSIRVCFIFAVIYEALNRKAFFQNNSLNFAVVHFIFYYFPTDNILYYLAHCLF